MRAPYRRHLASDLAARGHAITLIEQKPETLEIAKEWAPDVELMLGEVHASRGCSIADLRSADVVVAVTGDDEDNLVTALLAKQEYGVPKGRARVNHPGNEWLFTEQWGVDAAVSPAPADGDGGRRGHGGPGPGLLPLERGGISIVELTIPGDWRPRAGPSTSCASARTRRSWPSSRKRRW